MNLVFCEDDEGSCPLTASTEQAIKKRKHELPHHRLTIILNCLLLFCFVCLFYLFPGRFCKCAITVDMWETQANVKFV